MTSYKTIMVALFKLVLLSIVLFLAFRLGSWWTASNLSTAKERLQQSEAQLEQYRHENEELKTRNLVMSEQLSAGARRQQVDDITYDELTKSLEVSSNHIAKLNEELRFYRSIFSPANNKAGMQVHELKITRGVESRSFNYSLSVIQALKHDVEVEGDLTIAIEGMTGEKKHLISISEIGTPPSFMQFKYFQTFDGVFELPSGFQPTRIKVNLVREFEKGKKPIRLEQWFAWPAV